jgi:hypothetical protein
MGRAYIPQVGSEVFSLTIARRRFLLALGN